MSWVEPAGGFLDVVDVVDFAVLRHRLFPAVWQRSKVRVVVMQLVDRGAAGCSVSRLLGHALNVLVPDRRRAAPATTLITAIHSCTDYEFASEHVLKEF